MKEATKTTAETNTLTYYIVTNKKDNIADSGIIPCGISDYDLVYIIRHAGFLKLITIQKFLQSEAPKTEITTHW